MSDDITFDLIENTIHPFPNDVKKYIQWLSLVASSEKSNIQKLSFIFCDDDYLLGINQQYLQHDYYTDIITFPYREGDQIEGDMFISIDRVADNAKEYNVDFYHELQRVMVHGLLHLIGYGDKTEAETTIMRSKEDTYIELFHTL
jgi:probable rRNA maturation factor